MDENNQAESRQDIADGSVNTPTVKEYTLSTQALIAIVIILFLLVIALAMMVFNNYQGAKEPVAAVSPTPSIIPSLTFKTKTSTPGPSPRFSARPAIELSPEASSTD